MVVDSLGLDGEKKAQVELSEKIFGEEFSSSAIYEAFKNELANKRQGNSSTKTRGMVAGTTKKPWRQKGTGNARAGSNKSPLWIGGGIIFGPHKRSYRYELNSKFKKKATFSLLSFLLRNGMLKVVDEINLSEYSTKKVSEIFSNPKISSKKKVLLVIGSQHPNGAFLRASARNIPWLRVVNVESLELNTLYRSKEVIFTSQAIEIINNKFSSERLEEKPVGKVTEELAGEGVLGK